MEYMSTAFLSGLGTGLGLIIAIGTQNAYVLKQGILRNHPFVIALICSVIDALLISAGVSGLGVLITSSPILLNIAHYGGAAFLIYYGIKSFLAVFKTESLDIDLKEKSTGLKHTAMTVIALSLLNPHLYIDTCVLIGTIGAQFPEIERSYFTIGAISASFIWFFSLSYGAALLVPLFKKPVAWKILDFIIAIVMWSIAASLILLMN
jgi:L-lysine exporter family protein LysE/ArgO